MSKQLLRQKHYLAVDVVREILKGDLHALLLVEDDEAEAPGDATLLLPHHDGLGNLQLYCIMFGIFNINFNFLPESL